MMVSESITINAPRQRVFDIASDIPNAPARIPDITRVQMLTDGPVAKGTRWRETRKMWGKEQTETMEIAEFTPPEHYAASAHNCGSDYLLSLDFASAGPASTTMTITFNVTPTTLVARIMCASMGLMMKRMMRKCLRSDLENIKRASEAPA